MIEEHKNAVARQEKVDYFMRKAKNGEEKIRQRKERERLEKKRISEWEAKKKSMNRLASTVQRMYRGHLGRKRVKKIKQDKQKEALALAYLNLCATDLQRVYRGYCGRRDAEQLRMEMAEFLFSLRVQEASQEEDFLLNQE